MGCDNGPSFHNRNVYENGRWGSRWGSDTTYEAPDKDLLVNHMRESGYQRADFHIEPLEDGSGWIARHTNIDRPYFPYDPAKEKCSNGHSLTNWSDVRSPGQRRDAEGWLCVECDDWYSQAIYLSYDEQMSLASRGWQEMFKELKEEHPGVPDEQLIKENFSLLRDGICRRTRCRDEAAVVMVLGAEKQAILANGGFYYD